VGYLDQRVTFKLDNEVDNFVHLLNFWIQALLVKLLPCCGLTVLSALLLVYTPLGALYSRRK